MTDTNPLIIGGQPDGANKTGEFTDGTSQNMNNMIGKIFDLKFFRFGRKSR